MVLAIVHVVISNTMMVRQLLALLLVVYVRPCCSLVQEAFVFSRAVEGGVGRSRPSSTGTGAFVNRLHASAAGATGTTGSSSPLHSSLSRLQRYDVTLGGTCISRRFSSSSPTSESSLLDAEEIEQMKNEIAKGGSRMTPKGIDNGDQLLKQLIQEQTTGNKLVGLDAEFINGSLNSYRVLSERAAERARRGGKRRPDATFAKRADVLLAFVEQAYDKDPTLSPDTKSYSMVVDAYAKVGDRKCRGGADEIRKALEIWKRKGEAKHGPVWRSA